MIKAFIGLLATAFLLSAPLAVGSEAGTGEQAPQGPQQQHEEGAYGEQEGSSDAQQQEWDQERDDSSEWEDESEEDEDEDADVDIEVDEDDDEEQNF